MVSKPCTAREPAEEPRATAFIPYVAGLSEHMRRVCRRYNIWTVFWSASTLRRQLMRVKYQDPLEKKLGVVYELQLRPCIYTGDKESPRDPHKGAQNCHQTGRDREVGHSRAHLGTASPNTVGGDQRVGPSTTLLIKEALHICLTNFKLINRDEGIAIPECWQPVLDHAMMTSSSPHQEW